MNWHQRYTQQADWTRDLRSYIFDKTNFGSARKVLEVGCGTGAILSALAKGPSIHGLDIDREALFECKIHVPRAMLLQGNALTLSYPDVSFDIVYSHFLLLWVKDPLQALQEMNRVTRPGGSVIAFAEPDYLHRVDRPDELIPLGRWQTEALRQQGADPSLGARLAELFFEAEISLREAGKIQNTGQKPSLEEWKIEWEVIEADLRGVIPDQDVQRMKDIDRQAWQEGTRILHVPTYFAWGQV